MYSLESIGRRDYRNPMATYFVPYSGNKPAAMSINGHKLTIVSRDREALEGHLELFGADRVKRVPSRQSKAAQELVFDEVAKSIGGGVVIAPPNVEVKDVLKNLENQLPWLQ